MTFLGPEEGAQLVNDRLRDNSVFHRSPPSHAALAAGPPGAFGAPLKGRRKLRQYLEEIAHHGEIGQLVYGRLGIAVDRHDGLGRLYARQMLDGARYAHAYVETRRNSLAGKAHLMGIGNPAPIHRLAARTDGAAQNVSQFAQELEVFRLLEAAPSRNDDGRFLNIFKSFHVPF